MYRSSLDGTTVVSQRHLSSSALTHNKRDSTTLLGVSRRARGSKKVPTRRDDSYRLPRVLIISDSHCARSIMASFSRHLMRPRTTMHVNPNFFRIVMIATGVMINSCPVQLSTRQSGIFIFHCISSRFSSDFSLVGCMHRVSHPSRNQSPRSLSCTHFVGRLSELVYSESCREFLKAGVHCSELTTDVECSIHYHEPRQSRRQD